MKWEYKRCIRSASVKWFCFTTFQIEIDYTAFPHNWDLIPSQNLPGSTFVYRRRSKPWLSPCDSSRLARREMQDAFDLLWQRKRMIHWWSSWSARAGRSASHVPSLCPTTSKPLLLSGIPPMWINLATRGERGRLSQKWKTTEARRENKVLHWNGVKLSSQAKISLIIVCLLESGVTLSFKGKVWHF